MKPLPLFVLLFAPLCFVPPSYAQGETKGQSEAKNWDAVSKIFVQHCYPCHQSEKKRGGLALDRSEGFFAGGDSGPALAEIVKRLKLKEGEEGAMPPKGPRFTPAEIENLSRELSSLRPGKVSEPFWSLVVPKRPAIPARSGVENPVDAFLLQKLSEKGLSFGPPADKRTQIRRLKFDLVGLPPTPEEVAQFEKDNSPDAFSKLVEKQLASREHGERWARHWLDVVRFAESNGFETNTSRGSAWVYRDWVIRSINSDLPYDQFVISQLAGDQIGQPEGTGFLVGGPWDEVKSPDETLTRQQRADELHDMVSTTASAFLGLTGGCARCHSHKFDPVSHEDYHRIKAIFEGVRHGERDLPPSEPRNRELVSLKSRLAGLDAKLGGFRPLAKPAQTTWIYPSKVATTTFEPLVQPMGIEPYAAGSGPGERFCEGELGKFPTLGQGYAYWSKVRDQYLAAYRPGVAGEFVLGFSWGAGWNTHTKSARLLLDLDGDLKTKGDRTELGVINQQRLVEGGSQVPQKPLWSGLKTFGKIRLEQQSAIFVQAGPDDDYATADLMILQKVDSHRGGSTSGGLSLRSPTQTGENQERMSPLVSDRVRITIDGTNGSEPCLDEVEAFGPGEPGVNLLHKSRGVKVSASGSYPPHPSHNLEFINDGIYGNNKSWIGNTPNGVWVEFRLPKPVLIEEIRWSRDRTIPPQFADRVMTNYRIEVGVADGPMVLVADSTDRAKQGTTDGPALRFHPGKTGDDVVNGLVREHQKIQSELSSIGRMGRGYIGTFSQPGPTKLLFRGDPMQPRQEIGPGAFEKIGPPLNLPADAPEAQRRISLARWIVSPENPLTARVIVNRIWQIHFGTGIVATPSDFGKNGARPTHPELLDWLASELVDPKYLLPGEVARPWSLRHIQRLIVNSRAFTQSSNITKEGLAADAQTRLLWRYPAHRLEAEAIRDSILFVSGNLRDEGGGPGFDLFEPNTNYVKVYRSKSKFGPAEWRRMVYQAKPRMQLDDVFGVFDCPDAGQIAPKRTLSTTPLQSLGMLNSGFLNDQARMFSERVIREAPTPADRVWRAFVLAYQRAPDEAELTAGLEVWNEVGPEALCRALLASNEFLHPD